MARVGNEAMTATAERWILPRRLVAGAALVVLNAFLLLPLPLNEARTRLAAGELDHLLLFSVPASLLWLTALNAWARRPAAVHLALLPIYVAVGADLFLILHYDIRLSSSSLSVILDNQENAGDYLRSQGSGIVVPLLLGTAAYAGCLWALGGARFPGLRRLRWPASLGLLGLYLAVSARQIWAHKNLRTGLIDVASHDLSTPFGVIPQALLAHAVYRETIEHERRARDFRFHAQRDEHAGDLLVVLVLGESSRPDHWSLYGYERPTTPRLQTRRGLTWFKDVTAEAALTKLSVPLIITRADADTLSQHRGERSIVSAYREAGYRTAWLSTQQRDQWTGAINRYTNEADHQRFLERRHDETLLRELARWLGEPAQLGKPAFAVLHTQGSHFSYADRYPAAFARFERPEDDERARMIAAYDASILYTDHVLDSLIEYLCRLGRPAAMLYVADHGENLRDDGRNLFGHFHGNDKDIPIPMLLWTSESYRALDPERSAQPSAHRDKRVGTTAVFHTLLDLGRVTIPGEHATRRSLLRSTFVPRPRLMLNNAQEVVDFDARYPRPTELSANR